MSDSGFSPFESTGKGKGRALDMNTVDYNVLSIDNIQKQQTKAVDYVTDMLKLKVSSSHPTRSPQWLSIPP